MKVLLVDDNPIILRYLSAFLTGAGVMHETASNGIEALRKFTEDEYGMVVSDLDMPCGNGIALAKRVREQRPGTLLVAFSGSSGGWLMDEASRVFDRVLYKPDDSSQLISEIVKCAFSKGPGHCDRGDSSGHDSKGRSVVGTGAG